MAPKMRRQVGLKPGLNRTGTEGGQNDVGAYFDKGNLGRARRCGPARRDYDFRSSVYALCALAEGKADKAEGKVQNAIGGLKDAVRDAVKT